VIYNIRCLDVFMNAYNSDPNAKVSERDQAYFTAGSQLFTELWQAKAIENAMDTTQQTLDAQPTGLSSSEYSCAQSLKAWTANKRVPAEIACACACGWVLVVTAGLHATSCCVLPS
jgi:hypothetical protein